VGVIQPKYPREAAHTTSLCKEVVVETSFRLSFLPAVRLLCGGAVGHVHRHRPTGQRACLKWFQPVESGAAAVVELWWVVWMA
jgi:hypothetical protein